MASVIGKWKIESSVNFEDYMKAIGVSEDKREDAHKYLSDGSNMMIQFSADGDQWTMTTTTAMGEREFKFVLGQESPSATLDGRPVKVVFNVDGDSLVETQSGDGFMCTHTRTGSGDTLAMVQYMYNVHFRLFNPFTP